MQREDVAEDAKPSAFSFPQREVDYAIVQACYISGQMENIRRYCENGQNSNQQRVQLIKYCLNNMGFSHDFESTPTRGFVNCMGKGLTLTGEMGVYPQQTTTVTWVKLARRIEELIRLERFNRPYRNIRDFAPHHGWGEPSAAEGNFSPVNEQDDREAVGDNLSPRNEPNDREIAGDNLSPRNELDDRNIVGDNLSPQDGRDDRETVGDNLSPRDEQDEHKAVEDSSPTTGGMEPLHYETGDMVLLGDRTFEIDAINTSDISLRDITFRDTAGFPIFRSMSIEAFENEVRNDSRNNHLFISQPVSDPISPQNYRITSDQHGEGGARTKADRNVDAIRTLKKIEGENRDATPDEQEALAQYVGWGGIPQIFDAQNGDWSNRYNQLRELLNDNEYSAARASTLNAHYTSPVVIKSMYQVMENMGFQNGNILEPACGSGNFFGLVPDSMRDSKLYGVELDSITGRIAKKLYPESNIMVQGFETTELPDSYFDAVVGNVPFGSYKLSDRRYDKHNFLIHDYFIAKSLDKTRTGGVIALITSKGTLDKQNDDVRRYIAQRADLLGAIRLPNNAFQANAGTEVTTDIMFLQKRYAPSTIMPEWVETGLTDDGVPVNQYYLDNPHMMLGTMVLDKSMYGNANETTCNPIPGANLADQLREAIQYISGEIPEREIEFEQENDADTIPAEPGVTNFSYTIHNGAIYYRENSVMKREQLNVTADKRIRGLIGLRDTARELIAAQLSDLPHEHIANLQAQLNEQYDSFTAEFGLISSRGNNLAFRKDDSYYLLSSLEILDDEGKLDRKADMFTKRTIGRSQIVERVDTSAEALAVSLAEYAKVNFELMESLTGKTEEAIIAELDGSLIFQNPISRMWEPADEYLTGDVRAKLNVARVAANAEPEGYLKHIAALETVIPKDLEAHEIDVRLGSTWVPDHYATEFMHHLLESPYSLQRTIKAVYSPVSGAWDVSGKSHGYGNLSTVKYGTKRMNGYEIIAESLNLRDVRIFDTVYDVDGRKTRVFNAKETILAQQKQALIREEFKTWIWQDKDRRDSLVRMYNDKYNAIRLREYDGTHLRFPGMNPELKLMRHQQNAVARVLYGGNTLLAHTVGAGKTAVMVASVMEKIRLGLGQKALVAVPNHLTEQIAAEFLRFFPAANILVATKRDFEKENRKRFCAKVATGNYDAIIMGHSQFEKIPVSKDRQIDMLNQQIDEVVNGIQEMKASRAERFSIKDMEKTRKSLEVRLKKLMDDTDKDQVVTFEELGCDMLYVDEAHSFKNLAVITKMRNVAGISTTEAKKSTDMYLKCQYISELTGNRGIVFATGTPVSNSMTEMYTMQRYLQATELTKRDLAHFDAWASTFGETQTAVELAPEGTGYRMKTRFAKFYNLPELMAIYRQAADIQTPDMLNLPIPDLKDGKTQNILTDASAIQKEMVTQLAERAEAVRKGSVDPRVDNMLKITNDGRLLALDQRLINPTLPDDPNSKVNACLSEVLRIYEKGSDERLAQLVFCDLSTPKADGSFNVYDDLKQKLIANGIPEHEIAFIHDADTEAQKDALFSKVRKGTVRILMGSTQKMGAGTNVQERLIALHHLDCPWRPSDLEQRDGRILRQGNTNKEVEVLRYVTQDTFDAYSYQLVETKRKFIAQIFTSKTPMRGAEDMDDMALSYAEVKALAAGNPAIREKMDLDVQVARLKLLKQNHFAERHRLENMIVNLPVEIQKMEIKREAIQADITLHNEHRPKDDDAFSMTILGKTYTEKKEAAAQLMQLTRNAPMGEMMPIGEYCGFKLLMERADFMGETRIGLQGSLVYRVTLGDSETGNIQRINNALTALPERMDETRQQITDTNTQWENAKAESKSPFAHETELQEKTERLMALNMELDIGGGNDTSAAMLDTDAPETDSPEPKRSTIAR